MATPTIQTGANSTLVYYWEDNGFKSAPNDSTAKTFGVDSGLSAWDGSWNAVEAFDPNSREVERWIKQQFAGRFTVEFVFANPWWNQAVLTSPSTSGAGPYTHTYSGEDPSSMQLVTGNTRSGEDWKLKGCVASDMTLRLNVPGNAQVTINGAYAALEETEPATQETQVSEGFPEMTFAEGSLSIGGSVQSLIQQATLTISNNIDHVYELGDDEAVDFSPKARMLTVDAIQLRDNASDDRLNRFMGGGTNPASLQDPSTAALDFDLDNGESGTSERSAKYDLTSSFPNDFSISGVGDPTADIQHALTERPVSVTMDAVNDTSTAP